MLTIEDVEATIARLHEFDPPIDRFDKALRKHAYHDCGYCDQAVLLSQGKLNTPLVHTARD